MEKIFRQLGLISLFPSQMARQIRQL